MSTRVTLRTAAPGRPPGQMPAPRQMPAPGRTGGWRRWTLMALGLALLTVLAGCAIPGLSSGSSSSAGAGTGSDTEPGDGAEWFWYQQGERRASASTPSTPRASASSTGSTTGTGTDQPSGSARPSCLTRLQADTMYWLSATPGVGQASVSWMSLGDPRIVEYKVAAVLQNRPGGDNPPQEWTTVPKPPGCRAMTATVTGLVRGSYYVFWLDVVVTTAPTGWREPMIGRSAAFLVL